MILQPQVDFPIVRQIANHLDTDTYYVQAVVRNADGTIIETVNLTDQGSQRFQKRYRVPADGTGHGVYISIVTSVYTDSGYSTKSPNYGDEENTYLVFDKVTPSIRGGGAGGPGISDIRRVIAEELGKQEKEEYPEMPKMPEIPQYASEFRSVGEMLRGIIDAINKIPTEKTDLFPVLSGIQNLAEAIENKEVTPETDMEPLMEEVRALNKMMGEDLDANNADRENFKEEVKKTIVDTMEESVANTEYTYETAIRPRNMPRKEDRQQEEKKQGFNLRNFV